MWYSYILRLLNIYYLYNRDLGAKPPRPSIYFYCELCSHYLFVGPHEKCFTIKKIAQ